MRILRNGQTQKNVESNRLRTELHLPVVNGGQSTGLTDGVSYLGPRSKRKTDIPIFEIEIQEKEVNTLSATESNRRQNRHTQQPTGTKMEIYPKEYR